MAKKTWQVQKVRFCDHVGHEIAIEAQVVYPADTLPDKPRVTAHRCTNALECNAIDKATCVWCGTNPTHEPQ